MIEKNLALEQILYLSMQRPEKCLPFHQEVFSMQLPNSWASHMCKFLCFNDNFGWYWFVSEMRHSSNVNSEVSIASE